MRLLVFTTFIALALFSCGGGAEAPAEDAKSNVDIKAEAQAFIDGYAAEYQKLSYVSAEAEWQLNTHIVEGDTAAASAAQEANEAYAAFTGSAENIDKARNYLGFEADLDPLQVKQLERILYMAASNPATAEDIVKQKIAASTKQTEDLYGFQFILNGEEVSTNDLDRILKESTNMNERLRAWEASKEVGIGLKDGLENLRNLRNQSVQALGYNDYFAYQVSDYGMNSAELMDVCRNMIRDVWPLYRELHTWTRYTLAEKYGEEVPELLPAHWLPNRWGQDWNAMVQADGFNLDEKLAAHGPEWIVEQGEEFYKSLGFPALPETFHSKSSLYPVPAGADYKKNNHASAWHMDLGDDVRSLMSIEANTEWWETTLHELGHIYYYMEYSNPEVPVLLREGANRAYHEAVGSMMGLAAMQKPFLVERGLLDADAEIDETQLMLKEALNFIVLIPWGAGVMTEFEHDLYAANLSASEFNKRWWELKEKYQGIASPNDRGEEFCDAASKTHINNDPAQYYDYAMSNILLYQFHIHIAEKLLKQDPHATNYWGSKETGEWLKNLLHPGATVDWREHTMNNIGQEMSAKPMVDYFAPLMEWLQKENEGREHALPEAL